MTFGIISESDTEGRAVCQSWLPGGKHNVTPTDKIPSDESHPGELLTPPLFKGRKEATKFPEKNSLNKDSNPARRRRS